MPDSTDRKIINALQGGFPLSERPFRDAAEALGIDEDELIARIGRLRESGVLSRFGPMFDAAKMGGAFCLCAMAVPEARFDEVAEAVNKHPQVAHNYERAHALNMWFVLTSDEKDDIEGTARLIEQDTGIMVHLMPKLEEYFIGLKVSA